MNSLYKFVNLFFQVIESQRGARGCADSESFVQRLRAMMARPDSYSLAVEDGRYVVRVRALNDTDDADLFAGLPMMLRPGISESLITA